MKTSAAIFFLVSIITLSIAQPSGHAFWKSDPDSADAKTRPNGTVLQRPAGYAALDSDENIDARQATFNRIQIVRQNVIRIAPNDPGCSHIANKHYFDIDRRRLNKIISDETLTDGSGSQTLVAYIPMSIYHREPSDNYVYSYSMFARNAEYPKTGRLAQPTVTAPREVPRIPAPITVITTGIDATLLYRIRQPNECPHHPICRKKAPTITMTKRRLRVDV